MTEKELEAISSRLTMRKDRIRGIKVAKAQAEVDAINREYSAYCDGVDDAIRAVRGAMEQEADNYPGGIAAAYGA